MSLSIVIFFIVFSLTPVISLIGTHICYETVEAYAEVINSNERYVETEEYNIQVSKGVNNEIDTCMEATLSSDLILHIPYLDYNSLSLKVTFKFVPSENKILFELIDYSVNPSQNELCKKVIFSSDLSLYIPSLDYDTDAGKLPLWAKLIYVTNTPTLLFELADAGKVVPIQTEERTKFSMWTAETALRGANIWQSRNYVEIHGEGTLGSGPVGPPFTQSDFDNLATYGANYVNISHPGLYTETPPYLLDKDVQDNLDALLSMIAKADMFAVITFRTGPGRSEFWSVFGEDTTTDPGPDGWFDPSYYNHTVWTDQAAQDAWGEMWRYTAKRYKENPIVVGYDLMCEPNSGEMLLEIDDPADFYPKYADTLYDWNRFYPDIVTAIREEDTDTPILVQPMGYGSVAWLSYLSVISDTRTVYTVHQYEPFIYTHQDASSQIYTYPGTFDANYDESSDQVDKTWLENLLMIMDQFSLDYHVPVAVNEFGLQRWEPGADKFMGDMMALLEEHRVNYALWEWASSWEPFAWNSAFNFRYGEDPSNERDVTTSDLIETIKSNWSNNILHPSNVTFLSSDASSASFQEISLNSTITSVQPMTGIVLWSDSDQNDTDAIQLEFSYLLYDQVVKDSGIYDWIDIDKLLDEIASRNHQAILRFRFVWPGEGTSVPDFLYETQTWLKVTAQQ